MAFAFKPGLGPIQLLKVAQLMHKRLQSVQLPSLTW